MAALANAIIVIFVSQAFKHHIIIIPCSMFMHNSYSEQIEKGRKGLALLICNPRFQELLRRYSVTDDLRHRLSIGKDFFCDSTFYFKQNSMATVRPVGYLAEAIVDKDSEIIKWFILLYSVSSAWERFGNRFLDPLGSRALSNLGIDRFYRYEHYDLFGQPESKIATLVDGVIDVEGLLKSRFPDLYSKHDREWETLCQAVSLFALSAGYDYLEDLEHFPEKLLERCSDMPFVLACSEYITLMTGREYAYDEILREVLNDVGVEGCLDDLFLMKRSNRVLDQLKSEKRSLEDKLVQKKESIRQQETEIDIFADSLGKGFAEEAVQARVNKCNSRVHRDILYKLESISHKQLSFLDNISATGLPVPFSDLIKREYKVIISEKEMVTIKTIENLADSIVAHKSFIENFVDAVRHGKTIDLSLREDDPYDLETRIQEIEIAFHCEVDRSLINSLDSLKRFLVDNRPLLGDLILVLSEQLGVEPEEVTLESDFTNDLGADSLDSVELLMKAEKEYGIKIKDEETSSIRTVGDLYNIILEKLSN